MKGIGKEINGLYYLPAGLQSEDSQNKQVVLMSQSSIADKLLWHNRLGHPSVKALQQLSIDRSFSDVEACNKCPVYRLAKQTRLPFPSSMSKTLALFDLIHVDVWGPYRVATHNGFRFFLTIVDDKSRMCWLYLLRLKSDVFPVLKSFVALVKTQFNKDVKRIRSDNGTEFFNHDCSVFLNSLGIVHESSCPYTPQQNGIVERKHRHILEVARAVRFQGNIPIRFWGECVLAAVYLINRLPTSVLHGKSPYEQFHGHKAKLDHLRTIGCLCYATKLVRQDKFSPKAEACVLMGYSPTQKGYLLYSLFQKILIVSTDVVFKENVFPFRQILNKDHYFLLSLLLHQMTSISMMKIKTYLFLCLSVKMT